MRVDELQRHLDVCAEGPAPAALSPAERVAWAHAQEGPRGPGQLRLGAWGPHLELRLDNAAARGAISLRMMLQLSALSLEVGALPGGLVLRGPAPGQFCAGGDLRDVRARLLDREGAATMRALMVGALQRILDEAGPLVALVEGPALGGGAELLTWADEVILSADARVAFPQAQLGLTTGWGGGLRLIRKVGGAAAGRLLREPRGVAAPQALAIGIADQIVDPGDGEVAARAALDRLGALPRAALIGVRALLIAADPAEEAALFEARWGAGAHREALERAPQGRRP